MDFSGRRFFRKNLYSGKERGKRIAKFLNFVLFLFFLVIFCTAKETFLKPDKQIELKDLSGIGGGLEIIEDIFYIYDQYEYSFKTFNKNGTLLESKLIRGIGPGETSSKESTIFAKEGTLFLLDPILRKVIQFDKKLNFVREFKLSTPVSRLKGLKDGFVASVPEIGNKYKRSIYLLNDKFETLKVLYSEEGKEFGKKIDPNELYISFDICDDEVTVATQSGIKIISLEGKILNSLDFKITPSKYNSEELTKILKHIPEKAREIMSFESYPKVLFVHYLEKDKLFVISGEMKEERAKTFVFKLPDFKILNEFFWEGAEPKIYKRKIYTLKDDEICKLLIYDAVRILK